MSSLASHPPAPARFLLPMAVVLLLVGCLAAPVSAQTVPGAPTRVTATPANGSIILNWSAPESDGGSAINSYAMVCVAEQNNRESHGARPGGVRYSWTITGLTNGTPYNCRVAAYNAIGKGAESTVSATPVPVTNWVQLASGWLFTSATVGSADRYGGIVSGQHYAWNGSGWTPSAGSLRWISVGSASNVWGVNSSGLVYKLNAATGGWEMPTVPSGTFKGVATASDGTTLLLRSDGALWMK
jgi:hypothetical protein